MVDVAIISTMSYSITQHTLSSAIFPLCRLPRCVTATPQSLEHQPLSEELERPLADSLQTLLPHLGQTQLCSGVSGNMCVPYCKFEHSKV